MSRSKKAHVYLRKDGRYSTAFTDSQTKQRYTVYGKTAQECRDNLVKKRAEVEQRLQPATNWTFERYVNWWIDIKTKSYRARTLHNVKTFMRVYGIPAFGKRKMKDITQLMMQSWVNERVKENLLKPSTIRQYFAHFHTAFQYAVRTRILVINPCQYVELPINEEVQDDLPIFTPEQAMQVVEMAEGQWKQILLFALGTGARRNEILAVRWADLDMEEGTWYVCHNFATIAGEIIECKPKTRASIRTIPLPPFVGAMLLEHRREQNRARLKIGTIWQDNDLVFCDEAGGFIKDYTFNNVLKSISKKMETESLHPHLFRHWVATWLFNDDPKEVQGLLGHGRFATTADKYSHRKPGQNKVITNRLNEMIEQAKREVEKQDELG